MARTGGGTLTNLIAAITTLVSAIVIVSQSVAALEAGGFTPAHVGLVAGGALPWFVTPLTSALLHAGWLHLGINMVMLLLVGRRVEGVVGRDGFLLAYVVGCFAAAAAQWVADPGSPVVVIGASGAISAIFGLYGVFFGKPPQLSNSQKVNRWVHLAWLMVAWTILQVAFGYVAGASGAMLAVPAHIGGFAAGLLLHRPLLLWRYRKA